MFSFFSSKSQKASDLGQDFEYLKSNNYYFDSACQSLRPAQVIQAQDDYYQKYNSCGHRVKYRWGEITDQLVQETRNNLLKVVDKSSKNYTVAFGLNTTSGINTVLFQLPVAKFERIVISEIEHNSVFLPSLTWSQKFNKQRLVLKRKVDGSLDYKPEDLKNAVVLLNSTSNIDGRNLTNLNQLVQDTHKVGGIVLLDACQSFGHNWNLLKNIDFDAVFGAGHKMYGPSMGFTIIRTSLLLQLDCYLIGGSTVEAVDLDNYNLISSPDEIYARIEPGLQNYGGIIGLGEAIKWKSNFSKVIDGKKMNAFEYEAYLENYLNKSLAQIPQIKLLNQSPSPVVSLYSDKIDGHKLAIFLSEAGIMCRSGYHCCHYYLQKVLNVPPLLRVSLGLNNTPEQIDYFVEKLKVVVN
jgi:cysteine desulfurase/selenocysteine lyase